MSLEFRESNLWEDQSSKLACNGNAKKILKRAKKKFKVGGRIFEVFSGREPRDFDVSHSYVVLDNQADDEMALNQQVGTESITVEQAKRGQDITKEILKTPWKKLR
jgi:hypothetical protein